MLPKSSPEAVDALGPDGPPVVAIVETAMGLRQAFEIGSRPRVAALILGAVDLGAEVGLEPRPDAQEILYARSKVAIDSAAAGLRGPFDVVHLDFGDEAGLEEQCRLARALGFRGKACIHPAQVETDQPRLRARARARSRGRAASSRRSRARARACSR